MKIAVKRLAAVEVRPVRSRQHEFNAGNLRRELELPTGRTSGALYLFFYTDPSGQPVIDECSYTLYDSREHQSRSAEYRLYYTSQLLSALAQADDLLVLMRRPDSYDLDALIVRRGLMLEEEVLSALQTPDQSTLRRFTFVASRPVTSDLGVQLTIALAPPEAVISATIEHSETFKSAISGGLIPRPRAMAVFANSLLQEYGKQRADSDERLVKLLDAESELYFAMERRFALPQLQQILATEGAVLEKLLQATLRIQQSRKARRGLSLQNHFETILTLEHIPFTPQCQTEGNQTADFMIPGCSQYHDPSVPDEKIRMVACKTTVRERWMQVLHEAGRIRRKFLLTVDRNLTTPLVREMRDAALEPFLPRPILEQAYESWSSDQRPRTVNALLSELRTVTNGQAD